MGKTLYDKVFDSHIVAELAPGQYQLAVDVHLVNEVSSPQAFEALQERNIALACPGRTFACADHSISTQGDVTSFADALCEAQVNRLAENVRRHGIHYFDPRKGLHGIIHVVAPEQGLTQPGMVIACGDSHTSTHGAFGAVAFGIGTSQVRDVLATQTLIMNRLDVRRIHVEGQLRPGISAKDLALHILHHLGTKAGLGYAYEFCGPAISALDMEARMTLCNMAVEGGARCGYVNPDHRTLDYLRGRPYAPQAADWYSAALRWSALASDADAVWADTQYFDASEVRTMITWGTAPDQSIAIDDVIPAPAPTQGGSAKEALAFMGFKPGERMLGQRIDTAFIGSCTNARLSDLQAVADYLARQPGRVAPHVKALIVPGSRAVREAAIERGLDAIFQEKGFEFRDAGCSLCCGMNADRLTGNEVCASSSNRNFKGRQGSPTGRTLLMSPVMVAAAALAGEIACSE